MSRRGTLFGATSSRHGVLGSARTSRLPYSALLQSTSRNLQQALANAEGADTMAVDLGLRDQAANGQFQRRLCYQHLGQFAIVK